MNKYDRLIKELEDKGTGKMKVFGNSMTPILKSGSLLTFQRCDEYDVDDVCLSRVRGKYIDAHKITKKDAEGRYLISNNKGWDNGWTKRVFGKVIEVNGKKFR